MMSFKGAHFQKDIILTCVRWYVAYPLSYRQLEEMMQDRGVAVDHATINRWVVKDSPQLEAVFPRRQRPVWMRWRLDETYLRVRGPWRYLDRAVDKAGHTIDLLLAAQRDERAAMRFLAQAIRRHGVPETITIEGREANAAAIRRDHDAHGTAMAIRHIEYFNNIIERGQRTAKRMTRLMLGCKSAEAAHSTVAGMELMHRLKKGQLALKEGEKGLTPAEQCYALAASLPNLTAALCRRAKIATKPPPFGVPTRAPPNRLSSSPSNAP